MFVCAALLVIGAAVSWFGLREADARCDPDEGGRSTDRHGLMTRDWDARTYDRVADPQTRWGAGRARPPPARRATSASWMPAAGAAASPSCSPSACRAAASSRSTGRRR